MQTKSIHIQIQGGFVMRIKLLAAAVAAAGVVTPDPASAWSENGHRAVSSAHLAQRLQATWLN